MTRNGMCRQIGNKWACAIVNDNGTITVSEYESMPDVKEPEDMDLRNFLENEVDKYVVYVYLKEKHPYLFYSLSDIIAKTKAKIENPGQIHYGMAISFYLLKVAAFFSEHPEYVFDIPLYEDYLKKHGISKDELSVEEFLSYASDVLDIF